MRAFNVLAIVLGAAAVLGCASEPKRRFHAQEVEYGTAGGIRMHYHSAIYYPSDISLRLDGYVVGIEKIPKTVLIGPDGEKKYPITRKAHGGEEEFLADHMESDGTAMIVTHIVETKEAASAKRNCFIYNAYRTASINNSIPPAAEDCVISNEAEESKPAKSWIPSDAYANSWRAMDRLRVSIRERLKEKLPDGKRKYTHILVTVMGWNTQQNKAVRNSNSLALNLISPYLAEREKAAINGEVADESNSIRPLVIAVTWPSQWNYVWLDPIVSLASFGTKANDADEVGLTWLAVLLRETISQAETGTPVILVGHSFGSRAASVATCVEPAIIRPNSVLPPNSKPDPNPQEFKIDTVINFQGAFKSHRLFGESGSGGFAFTEKCKQADKFVATASRYDTAVTKFVFSPYTGTMQGFNEICQLDSTRVNCGTSDPGGFVRLESRATLEKNIYYINASALITDNAFDSGGGAHSDIYRAEHGAFIRNAMKGFPQPAPFTSGQ